MINFFAKSVVASVVVKRYRRIIVSTLCLFIFYFVVSLMYQDYVAYSLAIDNHNALASAFVIKWLVLVLGSTVYYLINFPAMRKGRKGASEIKGEYQKSGDIDGGAEFKCDDENPDDPFDKIRRRKVLKSKGDRGLESR